MSKRKTYRVVVMLAGATERRLVELCKARKQSRSQVVRELIDGADLTLPRIEPDRPKVYDRDRMAKALGGNRTAWATVYAALDREHDHHDVAKARCKAYAEQFGIEWGDA